MDPGVPAMESFPMDPWILRVLLLPVHVSFCRFSCGSHKKISLLCLASASRRRVSSRKAFLASSSGSILLHRALLLKNAVSAIFRVMVSMVYLLLEEVTSWCSCNIASTPVLARTPYGVLSRYSVHTCSVVLSMERCMQRHCCKGMPLPLPLPLPPRKFRSDDRLGI